jgi:hypothetical protein
MYGTHLVTVMTPILFETAFTPMDPTHRSLPHTHHRTRARAQDEQKLMHVSDDMWGWLGRLKMFSVYLPWFLIPLALTIKMVLYPKPFGDAEKQRANKPKRK